MRRVETYVGQQVYEWLFSSQAQLTMTAIAKVCAALLGTSGVVNGLSCGPTSPATMTVQIGPGEIYQMESLEATTCGTLPADTTHQILKQGIQLGTYTTSAFAAPTTSGQSINYLIEAQYQDLDISLDPTTGNSPVVLQFYNSTNPSQPWSGPNNSGSTSNTFRDGVIVYQIKAGAAATTGSQVTPSPDAGWIGLWVVTVPYGASSLTSSNIAQYTGSPILPSGILQSIVTSNLTYGVDSGTAGAVQAKFPIPVTSLVDGMDVWVKIAATNPGAATFTPNPGVIAAAPIVGAAHAALQGGELVASGRANLIYRADITSWVLVECTGASIQIAPGTASQHAVQLGQVTNTASPLSLATATPTQPTSAAQFQQIGNFQGTISVASATTLTNSIFGNYVAVPSGNAGGFTITLPSASGNGSKQFAFMNAANSAVTLSAGNFNSAYGSATNAISIPASGSIVFECDGTSYNAIGGSGAVGIAPRPTASTGPGNFIQIATSSTYALPAGGTWLYSIQIFAATAATSQGSFSGIAAGGSTIFTASSNDAQGWAWRIL